MDKGTLVLVEGAVSTVVLGRGVKKVISWDDRWAGLVAAGFVRVIEAQYFITPEPVSAPVKKPRKKAAPKPVPEVVEPVETEPEPEPDADA